MNYKKIIFFSILFLLAFFAGAKNAKALDVTATSCSQTDIQTAINTVFGTADTDNTVIIPACDTQWTIGQYLVINTGSKKIRLLGAGQSATKIKYFQIRVPSNYILNLVEWGNMTIYSDPALAKGAVSPFNGGFVRSSYYGQELYWHDLTIDSYNTLYVLSLDGWHGVITRLTLNAVASAPGSQNPYGIDVRGGDGVYSNHKADLGTRNALFVEDSYFANVSHSVSLFCDAFVVFRHNTVFNVNAGIDIHGPDYQGCNPYLSLLSSPNDRPGGGGFEVYDNVFEQASNNYAVSPRVGSAGIVYNNTVTFANTRHLYYFFQPQMDTGACGPSLNCGTGSGQTCSIKYIQDSNNGCVQALENWYIWNNTGYAPAGDYLGEIAPPTGSTCSPCLSLNNNYFNRAPSLTQDGFVWVPYTYPHPLAVGIPDTTPPAAPSGVTVS